MFDAARGVVGIRLAGATLLRRIEAEASTWQIHALEAFVPDQDSGFVVAGDLLIFLVSNVASIHSQQLAGGLLYTAKRILYSAFNKELERTLQAGQGTKFQHARLPDSHFIARGQQAQAAADVAEFAGFGNIALADILAAFTGIAYKSGDGAGTHRKAQSRAGGNGEAGRNGVAIGVEEGQDFVVVAHLHNSSA